MFNYIAKTLRVMHLWHGQERKEFSAGTVLRAKPTKRGKVLLTYKDTLTGKYYTGEKDMYDVREL